MRSSKMSPEAVMLRDVYPDPGPVVTLDAQFAPTRRSLAFVVVNDPLLLEALLPDAPIATSNGCRRSIPAYSPTRTSGVAAAAVNVTVTVFAPAATVVWLIA